MISMNKNMMIVSGALALAMSLVFCGCSDEADHAAEVKDGKQTAAIKDVGKRRAERKQVARKAEKAPKPTLDFDDDDDEDSKMTPEEKSLAEAIEKALDEEVLADAIACAAKALKCQNTEIRQAMVDTLGWFGEKALPELTPFLCDPDEDVRESAQNEWSMALSDIENDADKIGAVELAMNVINDEDFLEDISGEYIGVDEKLAVESLMRIIASQGSEKGIAKAKETYEFVTGDEWQGEAEAQRWIREEYQPDEE